MKKKHNSQLKVVDAFKQKGIEIDILNLDVSTKTSQEAADAVGCDIEQIAKSIVFFESVQNKLVQIFVSGPNKVNLESFQNQTNLRIEKADAEYVRESTGFAIGGVAPLGHKNRPLYFIDETLIDFHEVWCAAGTPSSLFKLKTEDLLKATELLKSFALLLRMGADDDTLVALLFNTPPTSLFISLSAILAIRLFICYSGGIVDQCLSISSVII